ncbi:MAG: 3-isopropylmalate dehydratase [Nitrospinae bacterium]|nr:3-isopropylmalate dehydratase [Nitrospinota bacterium]
MEIITGKAYVLGDDIDTDQIIPAEHLVYSLSDPEEKKNYGKFALSSVPLAQAGLPDGNIPFVKEGCHESEYSIIIAGKNFGCGSSREHAPFALNIAGVKAVLAEGYARIFYRNSIDGGFFIPFELTKRVIDSIKTGDEIDINISLNSFTNKRNGESYSLKTLGDVKDILDAGGIFNYARKTGLI